MNEDELITNICLYLEILFSENASGRPLDGKTKEEIFLNHIERNIQTVFNESTKHQVIGRILRCYVRQPHELRLPSERFWNFTMLCLTLIKGLNEALLSQQQHPGPVTASVPNSSVFPRGALRPNQENTVKKCLQFIIALGVFPNLIPSVKYVLRRGQESTLERFDIRSSVQQKYYRLMASVMVLLECLNQKTMESIILLHHSGDLLAALLQFCHAPIKKVENNQESQDSENVIGVEFEDFNWIFSKLKGCNGCSDLEFIGEMWKDRSYFSARLEKFLRQIPSPVLLLQLLYLQGASFVSKDKQGEERRGPSWLMRVCNQLLTDKLLEPTGLRDYIQIVLESIGETEKDANVLNSNKVEAVARIVAQNPAIHVPLDLYMHKISIQMKELLHLKDVRYSQIFPTVVSCIFLKFVERNPELSQSILSPYMFSSFWHCLQSDETLFLDGDLIASEEQVTTCIEDAYKIFVNNHFVLTDSAVTLLLSFYHLLFVMYMKLLNSVSYLKSKVEGLLLCILNRQIPKDALRLLQVATFEDTRYPDLPTVNNIKCEFGDTGGILVIKKTSASDKLGDIIDLKFNAITELLSKISDKKVRKLFFFDVLKKCTYLPEKEGSEEFVNFVNFLTAVQLFAELAENISDDLIDDVEEAVTLIRPVLESVDVSCGDKTENPQLMTDETVINCLIILSTLIGYNDQLKSSQWEALKTCIPPLQNLIKSTSNPDLKNMAEDICIAIQTHGVVLSNKSGQLATKHKKTELSAAKVAESKKLIEEINSSVVTDGDSFYEMLGKKMSGANEESQLSLFRQAMAECGEISIPIRGHGLIALCKLLERKDVETLFHKEEVFNMFKENLSDDDSYVYLPAINGLSVLGDIDREMVLPLLLSEFVSCRSGEKWSFTLKIGEALMKICRNLGEMTPKFREQFLNTYLSGVRHPDLQIRASSLSNLGEVCKALRFAIGPMLQEILLCITSVLKTDPAIEVRRAACLVIVLLLRGTGKDTFMILGNEMKDLHAVLKWIYLTEKDEALKLHAQDGLSLVDEAVTSSLQIPLIKEIRILDPF